MKAFICFALFAVASAIPLQDQVVILPDGPIPIPVEMLRSGAIMPVWRELPQMPELPIPDRNLRGLPNFQISEVQFLDMPTDAEIAPEAVKIVDLPELSAAVEEAQADFVPEPVNVAQYFEPANEAAKIVPVAEEIVSQADVVPEPVNVVEYFEPSKEAAENVPLAEETVPGEKVVPEPVNVVEYFEPVGADVIAPELPASEDAEMRFVKFVDSPATFDLKNMKVPIDAHDIV